MTMSQTAKEMAQWCDSITVLEGCTGYLLLLLAAYTGYILINASQKNGSSATDNTDHDEKEETPDPPRNFTQSQLRHFDGTKDPKTDEDKPIYLSLNGTVFDVTKGRDFYGPGGPYENFAGRECGAALAKMSFDTDLLDDLTKCEDLTIGEKNELENWIEKFEHYRCYPIMGRFVPESKLPCPDRIITMEELAKYNASQDGTPKGKSEGYAVHPIYIGALDKVFDVSFGGVTMYGKDGPYNRFAGKDVSRALALMSFDPKEVENTDIGDLEEKQVKVLKDWVNTFEEKKGYPVVGRLGKKL